MVTLHSRPRLTPPQQSRAAIHIVRPLNAITPACGEDRGADSIISSKVKLGGDISAAATDITLRAEILSYSRSRGLFAGVSLEGLTLRPDNKANAKVYGKAISAEAIVFSGQVKPPASAKWLLTVLNKRSPVDKSRKQVAARQAAFQQRSCRGGIIHRRRIQNSNNPQKTLDSVRN